MVFEQACQIGCRIGREDGNTVETVPAEVKKKGRPKGSKDKVPRMRGTEKEIEELSS